MVIKSHNIVVTIALTIITHFNRYFLAIYIAKLAADQAKLTELKTAKTQADENYRQAKESLLTIITHFNRYFLAIYIVLTQISIIRTGSIQ